jgi:Abnormal spindle-like microcephaly-assoc'd, ASPM-SPD-2-Hydin
MQGSWQWLRRVGAVALCAVGFGVVGANAATGITVTRAELNGGQLRVEGSGAVANTRVVVTPGSVAGTSDSNGAFRIESSGYSSSTCQVSVTDGVSTASHSLSGCTPSTTSSSSSAGATLSPTSLTFASQDIGTTSAPQVVTVTNSGTAGLFISSAAVPNTLDFTVVGDGCSGLTLAPGTSCSMSITFKPTNVGTRTAALVVSDNAPDSPQRASLAGTGTTAPGTTAPPLAIDTQFFACANDVCDVGAGSNVFVNNFFTTTFRATGGTAPYTFSGATPAGMTLRPSGLMLGSPAALGTQTFQVSVTDASGAKTSRAFSLTVTSAPAASPSGCQTGGTLKEALSGPAFNGRTPSGQATADETRFSGCGGFSLLSVQVKNVALPDGAVLWVTLDFMPVGTIALRGGSGTMATYNLGRFGVSNDDVRVYSALPDVVSSQQILIGGAFR